ncbi:leucine-rich repeat-containing protein 71-like isoform X3 [Pecten maximus]|uniref:leucine-rich repeat-containing protein 71-like isoform X3 n=1 Tax=Pecten maximus TaxID=6579 RepID=UPI0014585751|nr:leucine-rich repeat-containing protein 71-like isoform X3 [Pecten maximus]
MDTDDDTDDDDDELKYFGRDIEGVSRIANRVKMGKKVEKSLKEKNQSAVSQDEDDPNKTPEPYNCTGNFQADFTELCKRNNMAVIPPVVHRARPPTSQSQVESSKPEKGKEKGKTSAQQQQAEVEPDPELVEGEPVEPPPKTFVLKEKFEYFKPSVQVEMENYDKPDTVTEIYIRGWKIDETMMATFAQCWPVMEKLHTINLWNTGLTGETVTMMANCIPNIVNLRTLILDGNCVAAENWHELVSEESPLQNLSLRHCGITDKGAQSLGAALGTIKKANMKLISLNLAGNMIRDTGAEHIAMGLRMNRTLMSLSLASNQIGDKGAIKLGEVLSRFPLSHEEVVERRKQFSEKGSPDRNKSPPPSRRADSKDRPGSVRSSSHADKDKKAGKPSGKKKDGKGGKDAKEEEKHDKTKGGKKEKEDKGGQKKDTRGGKDKGSSVGGRSSGASIAADTKTAGKGKGKGKDKGKGPAVQEVEDAGASDFVNPLTDAADFIDGQLLVAGNRVLINLNLSRNSIGEHGLAALLKAMQYQTTLTHDSKSSGTGLMRIGVYKNKVSSDSEVLAKLTEFMMPKDPFYKPPPQTPDGDS